LKTEKEGREKERDQEKEGLKGMGCPFCITLWRGLEKSPNGGDAYFERSVGDSEETPRLSLVRKAHGMIPIQLSLCLFDVASA